MQVRFSGVAAFLAASILTCSANAAVSSSIGGDWVFHVDWGQLKYDMLCHIADDGGKLAGACQGYSGDLLNARGSVDASLLRFAYSTSYMQYDVNVQYDGTRDAAGGVSGTIQAGDTPGLFDGAAPLLLSDHTLIWVLHSQLAAVKPYDLFCSLAPVDEKKVRGRCATAGGPVMMPQGTHSGAQVTFSYTTEISGAQVRSQFTGTFDGDDAIEGSATSEIGGIATFRARRR